MKISVVMPVYNSEEFLNLSIESILNQTYDDFEFIIINDCSCDSSENIILSYDDDRIKYIKNDTNSGVAKSLNKGLEVAKGEYIARMDADDISFPERFEKQVEFLDNNPDIAICGSNVRLFDGNNDIGLLKYGETNSEISINMIYKNVFCHPSVMIRKSVLDEHGFVYDVNFEKAEDYKLWYDILKVGKGYNIQTPLLHYRVHENQVSNKFALVQHNAALEIKKMLFEYTHLPQKYFDTFIDVSKGKRDFHNVSEYQFVITMFYDFIRYNRYYDKKLLKKALSEINIQIYNKSKPKNYRCILFNEYITIMKSILYRIIKK